LRSGSSKIGQRIRAVSSGLTKGLFGYIFPIRRPAEEVHEMAVQSLERTFDILEILAQEKDGLGLTEIGKRVYLHKSTVFRLLSSLVTRGYIEKNPQTSAYRLSLKFIELCSSSLNNLELKTEALPSLKKLASLTTQAVYLAIRDAWEAIYIEKVETFESIRKYDIIGKRAPTYCTALGKALLTGLKEPEIRDIFQEIPLKPFTPNTITDLDELIQHVNAIRKRGWSEDNEEYEEGIRCIAAPIYDYRNCVIAAVSTSGPKNIISKEKSQTISQYVVEAAKDISKRTGYLP
jgi:IclR family KDG regulon transcriptional repressor